MPTEDVKVLCEDFTRLNMWILVTGRVPLTEAKNRILYSRAARLIAKASWTSEEYVWQGKWTRSPAFSRTSG
jgi:hypothetical protein